MTFAQCGHAVSESKSAGRSNGWMCLPSAMGASPGTKVMPSSSRLLLVFLAPQSDCGTNGLSAIPTPQQI
jgi:hypothetical protein